MLNLPYFPKQDNQSYQSQKASRALPHRQRAMAAKVCQSNYNIFKTLPYGLRLPANIFAVCLPAFSVAPEILTPCPWSKPLLGLFEFAPCFSHSLSVFHAAVKLSFLFTVILLVRINRRFWSRCITHFFFFSDVFFLVRVTVLKPREVTFSSAFVKISTFTPKDISSQLAVLTDTMEHVPCVPFLGPWK